MILNALVDYYERKKDTLSPEGFEVKEIPFIVIIDKEGKFLSLEDTRNDEDKKPVARKFRVPQGEIKGRAISANLFWDSTKYALGLSFKKLEEEGFNTSEDCLKAFKARLLPLSEIHDEGVDAMIRFLDSLPNDQVAEQLEKHTDTSLRSGKITDPLVSFRLVGDAHLICERPAVLSALVSDSAEEGYVETCLITGERTSISRLHTKIKGVQDAQTSGASIVSFNDDAFCSYGFVQSYNAPVGTASTFAYTTALNALLAKGSSQKMRVGDATTVFWADRQTDLETAFIPLLDERQNDDPSARTKLIEDLYRSPHSGALSASDDNTFFYVLGLAPNAGRIAIRYYHRATVTELKQRLVRYFEDIALHTTSKFHPTHPTLYRLLTSIAVQEKAENIPPLLAGSFLRTILEDLPFPHTLLEAAVRRSKASRDVSHEQASLIKACLNRRIRHFHLPQPPFAMSLDKTNTDPGYRLGRLFATLEHIQKTSNLGRLSTIRESFYASASSKPATVFPLLYSLMNVGHMGKLRGGLPIHFEKLLIEIHSEIKQVPKILPLSAQASFALGYYHQLGDLYTKKSDNDDLPQD